MFNDFGKDFACVDPTGEQPQNGMIVSIEEEEEAMVTCLDETRHGLEDGDYVTFTEVKGMDINSAEPRKVTTKGELSCLVDVFAGARPGQLTCRAVHFHHW